MNEPVRILPAAPWTRREDLAQLVGALGDGNVRWVGGAVRDTLLGLAVADIDAATPLLPDEVTARLGSAGIKSVPTGLEHGTVTAILPGGHVEITTLRRDVATDGRRAVISFATEWREDAARRDFTINALYAEPRTLEIMDFHGGLEDLTAGRVRFIGDPEQRIREDHLRVLRYFRFQARFGSQLDTEAEDACARLAPMLKGLSRERVASELLGLLSLPAPQATVARMFERGVLPVVLPECDAEAIAALGRLVNAEKAHGIAPDPIRRLAALLPADGRRASEVASRLRLANAQKKRLEKLAMRETMFENPRALAYRIGRGEAIDWQLLTGGDPAPLEAWQVPVLPLKGGEIVGRGIEAGPEVARILQAVERRWVEEDFPPRDRVEALLDEELTASR